MTPATSPSRIERPVGTPPRSARFRAIRARSALSRLTEEVDRGSTGGRQTNRKIRRRPPRQLPIRTIKGSPVDYPNAPSGCENRNGPDLIPRSSDRRPVLMARVRNSIPPMQPVAALHEVLQLRSQANDGSKYRSSCRSGRKSLPKRPIATPTRRVPLGRSASASTARVSPPASEGDVHRPA